MTRLRIDVENTRLPGNTSRLSPTLRMAQALGLPTVTPSPICGTEGHHYRPAEHWVKSTAPGPHGPRTSVWPACMMCAANARTRARTTGEHLDLFDITDPHPTAGQGSFW